MNMIVPNQNPTLNGNLHQGNTHAHTNSQHPNTNNNNNKNMGHTVVPLVHPLKSNMEYYGKNINMRSPPTETHGISINVNIQNMIQQRDNREVRETRDTRENR